MYTIFFLCAYIQGRQRAAYIIQWSVDQRPVIPTNINNIYNIHNIHNVRIYSGPPRFVRIAKTLFGVDPQVPFILTLVILIAGLAVGPVRDRGVFA